MAYNPREDDKVYLGTQMLDNIENGVIGSMEWLQNQAKDDPDRYTDDMLRLLGGGVKNIGWAISKIPFLDKIAQGEDWLAGKAREMSETLTPWLDPRFAGWGTRIGTGLLADKGIRKATLLGKAKWGKYQMGKAFQKGSQFRPSYIPEEAILPTLDSDLGIQMMAKIDGKVGSGQTFSGTTAQRLEAAYNRLKAYGKQKKRYGRSRTRNAQLVNYLSDKKNFRIVGKEKIEKYLESLTEFEKDLIGSWHLHHKRPLSQHAWLVQGLDETEVLKAQQYSYKRMAAGGDVLNNQRITPIGPHNKAHSYMNTMVGEMRSGAGRSIEKLLDPGMTPQDYLKLDTFAKRKAYISRFFDYTDEADKRIGDIIDAIDVSKSKGATLSLGEVTKVFNTIEDINDISILRNFADELNLLMDAEDLNSLKKINEALNWNDQEYIRLTTKLENTKNRKLKKSIKKQLDQNTLDEKNLSIRKAALVPDEAYRRFQLELNSKRGSTPGNIKYTDYDNPSLKGLE